MKFNPPLQHGQLLRRYKRFLADVALPDGTEITIHCPNTGSMKNCLEVGQSCWFSHSNNPKRKYAHTWEIATTPSGHLAGINTGRANELIGSAIQNGTIKELSGYQECRAEVRYGQEKSRIDWLLSHHVSDTRDCYVEVKNVTLMENEGQGFFPDSVSQRGTKHLRELMSMVESGHRAVLMFCVQHTGIEQVAPADHIDQQYGETLREAVKAGVEVLAYSANISAKEIFIERDLPVRLAAS
ncbi:DNA/RNA nuclease SfsA [Marinibactrum halimedae]|uniref:Sugar fermentation stimulation protein homolog n=1 Tax=Marinibactrum halimedae TaxID=1444977 RepID=A0AA37WN15_9GAMM|nr:DNA/RNA nuclease SfsA [Marinibactrum halimedae]MCD9458986.1 DNA/RNA nuclease SfsA [Marinibactrum halimedae]GLS26885.1 sugar fermentation stimulation protein [Marinibactrum halimedae]